jgi:putative transposase
MEIFYRRHLPHYQPLGATYFVTFRLAGSLPTKFIKQQDLTELRDRHHDHFERLDSILNSSYLGTRWLRKAAVAEVVQDAIMFQDGIKFDLYASCIMPTHVHMVFQLLDGNATEIS